MKKNVLWHSEIQGPPALVVYGGVRLREGTPEYEQGMEIGREAWRRGWAIRTGGGPGAGMAAPMRGNIESRTAAGVAMNELNCHASRKDRDVSRTRKSLC